MESAKDPLVDLKDRGLFDQVHQVTGVAGQDILELYTGVEHRHDVTIFVPAAAAENTPRHTGAEAQQLISPHQVEHVATPNCQGPRALDGHARHAEVLHVDVDAEQEVACNPLYVETTMASRL